MHHASPILNVIHIKICNIECFGNFRCDVGKQSDWEGMWEHTEKTFGEKVEVLVNNAGVNPLVGWKICLDVMIYGVMIGSFLARERMGSSKVKIWLSENYQILCTK